ncbi:MAG: hypothetical protein CM15mP122_5360 [Bacteroidota bacterium]|nr:MAG: hypothetical protein CM15mP122_5360 [Bacteroidota bacterium]
MEQTLTDFLKRSTFRCGWSIKNCTATAGSGAGQFDNGDRISVEIVANGCTFTDEITILVDFFGGFSLCSIFSDAPGDTICSGEQVIIEARPPVPGYTYSFT